MTSAFGPRYGASAPGSPSPSSCVVSTVLRAAAARSFTVPWIAPDEMLYALIGESLWETGSLTVRGLETPYYSLLYPALVGLPLSLGDIPDGIRIAQALQALVMSLAAVPVFLWGRRFLSDLGALAAAVLTLAVPAHGLLGAADDRGALLPARRGRARRARPHARGADDVAAGRLHGHRRRRRPRCGSRR